MMLLSSFVLGLVFGSFLNVVIYRLNKRAAKSIMLGRSFCPDCQTTLKWHDLVPVLSFLYLWGRCRYCDKKISWQYPIVEILSGFVWVGTFYKVFSLNSLNPSNFLNFFYHILILSALLIIAVYDFKWKIIPDKIVYPAIAAALIFNFFKSLNFETFKLLNFEIWKSLNPEIFIWPLVAASAAFFFFFSIYFFSKGRAMGLGDAKLAFLIGLFLSPLSATIAFTLAFIIGAIFGIMLIGLGKKNFKSQIAFGPFLVLGVFTAFFFSDFITKLLNI